MTTSQLCAAISLLILASWTQSALGQESSECANLTQYAPPGSQPLTHGEIIGQPGERAPITSKVPLAASDGGHLGYLITGDRVEFIAKCQGFSYVRYHGRKRTTTGWIDSRSLLLYGNPFIPSPTDANQLCSAAERDVNNHALNELPSKDIPDGTDLGDADDQSPKPLRYIPLQVEGRELAVVQLIDGGTCSSTEAEIRTGDLKHVLSPADAVSRDPVSGGIGWSTGLNEDVVSVEGKPLLRSSDQGANFVLSSIDKAGDTKLVCYARLRPLVSKRVVTEGDPDLCESIASSAAPIVMHSPEGHFAVQQQQFSEVHLQAVQWGMVDLDGGGQRPVGVINYNFSSGAGCGFEFNLQFPLALNGAVVSWPQAMAGFRALYGNDEDISRPSSTLRVRIVRYENQSYVELLDASFADGGFNQALVNSVWKFTSSGPKQICKFRTSHYVVEPQ
jgi:hypothetical protein